MKISVILPILIPTPFLRAMTEFCIKTLRAHAAADFELVVVEAESSHFDPTLRGMVAAEHRLDPDPLLRVDRHLCINPRQGSTKEFNMGLREATGDFIVCMGNDIIVPPGWDAELLRVFEANPDCGLASLSAMEPGFVIGPGGPVPVSAQVEVGAVEYVEGMYSPFMMWKRGWDLDESFVKIYCDSDLVMRIYEAGYVAYRSCRAHVHHLVRMTNDRVDPEKHNADLARDEKLFYQRWGKSRRMMFGMIRAGGFGYGREHEAFTRPINLHYKTGE